METVTTYVEKGGVGKTTTAAHIAVAAHQEHDRDVLLLDLAGTQNDLASQFGLDAIVEEIDAPISTVFGDDYEFVRDNVSDLLNRMTFETDEGPDLIPADPGLGAADNSLASVPLERRYDQLDRFLDDLVADEYDLLVMDLPGKEDNIALNGLSAAKNVVAPLRPGKFELNQLARLDAQLGELSEDIGETIELVAVVPTVIDSTTNLSEEFVAELEAEYPDLTTEPVAKTADIGSLQQQGKTLFAAEELYETGERARKAYREIADQIINQI